MIKIILLVFFFLVQPAIAAEQKKPPPPTKIEMPAGFPVQTKARSFTGETPASAWPTKQQIEEKRKAQEKRIENSKTAVVALEKSRAKARAAAPSCFEKQKAFIKAYKPSVGDHLWLDQDFRLKYYPECDKYGGKRK